MVMVKNGLLPKDPDKLLCERGIEKTFKGKHSLYFLHTLHFKALFSSRYLEFHIS